MTLGHFKIENIERRREVKSSNYSHGENDGYEEIEPNGGKLVIERRREV